MPRANGITRQEILASIKIQGALTAEDLARDLGISQVAVRQHLASMEAEGIIMVSVERRGLGRPSHRYTLTAIGDEAFPRHYDALSVSLLDEMRAWQGEEAVSRLLELRQEHLQKALASRLRDKPLPQKLTELAQIQTEQGYMAEVTTDGESDLLLIKRNCAVCAVARHYPEVCCKAEAAMLGKLLGTHVTRETAIVNGDSCCTLRVCNSGAEG